MNLSSSKNQNIRILIVDDTPANIGLIRNILQPEGYQIFIATSGEAALKSALQIQPHLVLLDVMMPGMDGYATCRAFKENPKISNIPIIFVTAKTDTQDIVDGFHVGAIDYINKPVRVEEVSARVRTHIKIQLFTNEQREQAERFRAIVNNMAEGMLIFEANGNIQFANPACHYMLEYQDPQLIDRSIYDLFELEICNQYLNYFSSTLADTRSRTPHPCFGTREVTIRNKHGKLISIDLTLTPMFASEALFIGLLHDLSQHKQTEQMLLQTAHLDRLTRLANRRHFDTFLEKEWQRASRNGQAISLLLIDLDHFGLYNEQEGYHQGDKCLQQVARVVEGMAKRSTDLAARFNGEQFALLFAETSAETIDVLAQKTCQAIADLAIAHTSAPSWPFITVSIGCITLFPNREMPITTLFNKAETALIAAKNAGRNCWSW